MDIFWNHPFYMSRPSTTSETPRFVPMNRSFLLTRPGLGKKIEFQLALRTSISQILLALGKS